MNVQEWTFGIWVVSVLTWHGVTAAAQESPSLPIASPAINPIDPAALNAAPAFGDSGPVSKPAEPVVIHDSPAAEGTTWIPKLRVVLVTSMSHQTEVTGYAIPFNAPLVSPTDKTPSAVRKITHMIDKPSQKSVILTCDDVNVEAVSSEKGEPTYSFACKGKAVLTIDSFTVTGDSISASEGKLTITNAVIKSDQATMISEKLELQLSILGVQVGAANPSDYLKPTPDPINGGHSNNGHSNNGESKLSSPRFDDGLPFDNKADVFPPST